MFNVSLVTIKLFNKSILNYLQGIPSGYSNKNQAVKVAASVLLQQYYSKDSRNSWRPPENKYQIKRPQFKLNRPNFPKIKPVIKAPEPARADNNLNIPKLEPIKVDNNLNIDKIQIEEATKISRISDKQVEVETCVIAEISGNPDDGVTEPKIDESNLMSKFLEKKKLSEGTPLGSNDEDKNTIEDKIRNVMKDEDKDYKNRKDEREKSWKNMKLTLIALGASFGIGGVYSVLFLGKPKLDDDGNEIIDEHSKLPLTQQYLARTMEQVFYYNKLIAEPSREKLLPDVVQPPYYQPPYTLVLEFTDVLVHPEWTYSTGWRFKKRPGLDYFLETLHMKYELVVYTAEAGLTVFPIVDGLDKKNLISYKLVRDATNFLDGHHVKDLDKLNRDLSKVIVVDWDPTSTKLHKHNLFQIPRWDGNDDDTLLYDLTSFLLTISNWKIEDVRGVLSYYSTMDNPLKHFKERLLQVET